MSNGLLDAGIFEAGGKPISHTPAIFTTRFWMHIITPSFMTRSGGDGPRKPLRSTAWLDGLRGFAAFLVYWGHHQLWARDTIKADAIFENGYGYDGQYYFATLPGVRTFFSGGHYSVTVFFVVSGYCLSHKPLSLIQAGEYLKLGDSLATSLFKRWIRLHLPVIATTFLYMASWHVFGFWTASEHHQDNFRAELWNWYIEFKNFSFVFRTGGESWFSYNFHVWSIPVEFRGSIIIYTAQLAFSRVSRNSRLWGEVALIYYFMYIVDGWFGAMFMAGMLLCDLDLLATKNNLPRWMTNLEPHKDLIFNSFFVISVLLGGIPSHSADIKILRATPGWYWLSFFAPQAAFDYKWFYLSIASSMMVACIPRIGWLKSFFETRFCQYMGKISFCFYLVHGPVLWILADRLYVAVGWAREIHGIGLPGWIGLFPISKAGPLGFEPAFWLPHLIIFPFTLWLAEVAMRLFDEPSVSFAAWLYKKAMPSAPSKH